MYVIRFIGVKEIIDITFASSPILKYMLSSLPIERLFLPCEALPLTSLPLVRVAKTFLVALHTGCLAFLMGFQYILCKVLSPVVVRWLRLDCFLLSEHWPV